MSGILIKLVTASDGVLFIEWEDEWTYLNLRLIQKYIYLDDVRNAN